MLYKNIPLDGSNPNVYISAYILGNSNEFDTDMPRPAMLILPGGGYTMTSDREAEFVALKFAAEGFHAFVLRYSVKKAAVMPQPVIEAFRAVKLIRDNAAEWFVDPAKLAVCGFSAGGHLASCAMTMWGDPAMAEAAGADGAYIRPSAGILSYPCIVFPFRGGPVRTEYPGDLLGEVIEQVMPDLHTESREEAEELVYAENGWVWMNFPEILHRLLMGGKGYDPNGLRKYSTNLRVGPETPPAFVWATRADQVVPVEDSVDFVSAMIAKGCGVEFHMFGEGPHGLSLAQGHTAAGVPEMVNRHAATWFPLAVEWLRGVFEA